MGDRIAWNWGLRLGSLPASGSGSSHWLFIVAPAIVVVTSLNYSYFEPTQLLVGCRLDLDFEGTLKQILLAEALATEPRP